MPTYAALPERQASVSDKAKNSAQGTNAHASTYLSAASQGSPGGDNPLSKYALERPGGEGFGYKETPMAGLKPGGGAAQIGNDPVMLLDREGLAPTDQLKTGQARALDARLAHYDAPRPVSGKAEFVHPDSVFQDGYFSQHAISTDLINPQKMKPSSYVSSTMNRKEGGGLLLFTAMKVDLGKEGSGFAALQVVEDYRGEAPSKDGKTVLGYWAPQGGYVDIPANPNGGAKYVFTPGFSGCTLCVDQLNEDVLRVWHVEGGKEDAQYNKIDKKMHGIGMASAMEYRDYGYHSDERGDAVENVTGFAYLKVDEREKGHKWRTHYQGQLAAPNIAGTRNTFLGGKIVDALVSKDSKVTKAKTSEPIHRMK
jgi:insecticidal toxin complex protein TccC